MAKMFTTPTSVPEGVTCRTLKIPSDGIWLGIFNQVLLETLNQYNWEQTYPEDMTIEDTMAVCQAIIDEYWTTQACFDCMLPGTDAPPFRLGINGHFEQLSSDGGWVTPNGEYEIPPTPAREEATTEERLCAAAANAAHVMQLLYEAITDEIALGGDALQVAAALLAALVSAVGGWIAVPVYAIIQLTIALFVGMVELLQVLGGDVWTTEFNDKLMCAFLNCATDTGDVVTFDLDCIREQLNQPPDLLNPNWFYELQLFAQVLYLLEVITMDGLNAAGATTGVVGEDCGECGICATCNAENAIGAAFTFDAVEEIEGWTHNRYDAQEGGVWYLLNESYAGGHGEFVNASDACVISVSWSGTGGSPFIIKIGEWVGGPFAVNQSPQFPPTGTHGNTVEIYLPDAYSAGTTYLTSFSMQFCFQGE